jgi:plastocyanin
VTRRPLRIGTAAAVAVPLALLAGCGGGKHAASQPAAAPATVTVELGEYFFRPARLTVHVGQRVRFLNVGKIAHTVADRRKGSATPLAQQIKPHELAPGAAQTVVFRRAGTVYYFCTFHPTLMAGTITVLP